MRAERQRSFPWVSNQKPYFKKSNDRITPIFNFMQLWMNIFNRHIEKLVTEKCCAAFWGGIMLIWRFNSVSGVWNLRFGRIFDESDYYIFGHLFYTKTLIHATLPNIAKWNDVQCRLICNDMHYSFWFVIPWHQIMCISLFSKHPQINRLSLMYSLFFSEEESSLSLLNCSTAEFSK